MYEFAMKKMKEEGEVKKSVVGGSNMVYLLYVDEGSRFVDSGSRDAILDRIGRIMDVTDAGELKDFRIKRVFESEYNDMINQ